MLQLFLTSPVLWVLLLVSIIASAIIIERFFMLGRVKVGGESFTQKIIEVLGKFPSAERIEAARQFCLQELASNLSARVIELLLKSAAHEAAYLEKLILAERDKLLPLLEQRLAALSTIAAIAPLLGLLGTVIGMIKAFIVISQGSLESAQLAGGISEALLTTAFGLIIAIPSIVCYNYFVRKVEHFLHDLEMTANAIIQHLKQ